MSPGNLPSFVYNSFSIERYVRSLPLKRRILAHFFEKHRVTEQEYLDWYFKNTQ